MDLLPLTLCGESLGEAPTAMLPGVRSIGAPNEPEPWDTARGCLSDGQARTVNIRSDRMVSCGRMREDARKV